MAQNHYSLKRSLNIEGKLMENAREYLLKYLCTHYMNSLEFDIQFVNITNLKHFDKVVLLYNDTMK